MRAVVAATASLALVATGQLAPASADDGGGTGVANPGSVSSPGNPGETPASVQGPEPEPMVDPAPARTSRASSEWIVLCTGYTGCANAGYGNAGYSAVSGTSYWSQYAGHNCTNYVAYRMIRNGMSTTRPEGSRGYARDWGVGFASQTNDTPAVGSVAWWDTSFSSSGHVAYVEQVISSSEIIISEDNWGGDFRWRKVTRTGGRWPQGFIHLRDVATTPQPVTYQAITPTRIVDTRTGLGASARRVPQHTEIAVQVAGRAGLPASGVQSVVLNVTAVDPQWAGYLTVRPESGSKPSSSNVNYGKHRTVANQVVSKVGSDGRVRIYSSADSDVVVDVAGYYSSTQMMTPLSPARLLDTRSGLGASGQVAPGARVDVPVLGRGGVPTNAAAVVLNVTAVEPTSSGYATVWPAGGSQPSTSNLNYAQNDVVAGLVVAKVGAGGKVSVGTSARSDLVADVLGWIPSTSDVVAGTPARVLDTRTGVGAPAVGMVDAGETVSLKVTGRGGVPSTGVKAVMLTLTVTGPEAEGYETAFPAGAARPLASNLNYTTGRVVANSVLAKVGSDGTVQLYTSKDSHLVADVQGYVKS